MKVLLFANDLMPFGPLPTSGGGLRCFQLMKGLEAHGVEVIASMPGFTFLAEKHFDDIPEERREYFWRWGTQDDLVRRVKPDAVLFASNWDHFNLLDHHDVPIIIDLHGSRLIETTMWGNPVSTDHKVSVLGRADCLLAAGTRQRSYFYGWLTQAGRFPRDEHFIRYIPISLAPEMPRHIALDPDADGTPHIVSGGGWFPWQNQSTAIFRACREVVERDRGVIDLYGTPHETPMVSAEEQAIRNVYKQVQKLAAESPRVNTLGYVGRDRLVEVYRHASVALEAMRYNLERELAFTTRTIEYLWCGLPVIYHNYGEISEHLREYDAGWVVDPDSDSDIATALDEVFRDPAAVDRKSANAQRLVRDRFTWDKTVLPLLDFLQHPERAPKVHPALGSVSMQPSYFGTRTPSLHIPLHVPRTRLRQPFMIPAEHARRIELPFTATSDPALISSVTIQVKTMRGRVLVKRRYDAADVPRSGTLSLTLPAYRRAQGGERLVLELDLRGSSETRTEVAHVGAVPRAAFPLLSADPASKRPALALTFSPALSRFDRYRFLSGRAVELLQRGQVRLLMRVAARRVLRSAAARMRALHIP
jgi:glycosyltransferase involved in cell wall biosynthesis